MGVSISDSGRQPPEGPPMRTALKRAAAGDAAADVLDDAADGDAHRHLDQPAADRLAGQGEDLGPLALGRAVLGEGRRAVAEDPRQVGEGLDVVDQRGVAEQAALGRIGRAEAGDAAAALDRLQERGLLAADEGPGPLENVELQLQRMPRRQAAEQVPLPEAVQGLVHPLDGKGVFRPHVDDGLRGAHRVGRDRHPLDDPVGERLHEHAVHEGPRVAFVAVADHVLGRVGRLPHDAPLHARGKTGPAPSPQPALADLLDHFRRLHLLQATGQRGEAAAGQVFVEVQRVAAAEMFGGDMDLRPEEGRHVRFPGGHGAGLRRDRRRVVQAGDRRCGSRSSAAAWRPAAGENAA